METIQWFGIALQALGALALISEFDTQRQLRKLKRELRRERLQRRIEHAAITADDMIRVKRLIDDAHGYTGI